MSYINPKIKAQFDTLPNDLKNALLEKNVNLNSVNDLISALDQFVKENEGK